MALALPNRDSLFYLWFNYWSNNIMIEVFIVLELVSLVYYLNQT
jgi:hypothetical protein